MVSASKLGVWGLPSESHGFDDVSPASAIHIEKYENTCHIYICTYMYMFCVYIYIHGDILYYNTFKGFGI